MSTERESKSFFSPFNFPVLFHFPPFSFLRSSFSPFFLISPFLSDISIARLLPPCLRGELEHMCATQCVCVCVVHVYVLRVRSLHVTLTGTKQVQAKWI